MTRTSIDDVIEAVRQVRDMQAVIILHEEAIQLILQRLDAIELRLDAPPKRRR